MSVGPGKYDAVATLAREHTGAVAVILCVIEGRYGNGFSVQTQDQLLLPHVPALLRQMADMIEADVACEARISEVGHNRDWRST